MISRMSFPLAFDLISVRVVLKILKMITRNIENIVIFNNARRQKISMFKIKAKSFFIFSFL